MITTLHRPAAPPMSSPAGRVARGLRRGLAVALLAAVGCREPRPAAYQGYLEADFVFVGSPVAGTLTNLAVARGDAVQAGQLLFELESDPEAAAAREAAHRLAQAQARLDDLRKGLRPVEIAALEAQLERAMANLQLSESELKRQQELIRERVISPAEMDLAETRRKAEQAQVNALKAEVETARLGGRADAIRAAEAEVETLRAALTRAEWSLARKRQAAPAAGRVHDTLYRPGEFVPAGLPIVSLLPPANLRARFFVPEPEIASIQPGMALRLHLDGVAGTIPATVSFISPQAEYTPPVIYSQESRAKLVFMVEARLAPEDAAKLRPGQPLDVLRGP